MILAELWKQHPELVKPGIKLRCFCGAKYCNKTVHTVISKSDNRVTLSNGESANRFSRMEVILEIEGLEI